MLLRCRSLLSLSWVTSSTRCDPGTSHSTSVSSSMMYSFSLELVPPVREADVDAFLCDTLPRALALRPRWICFARKTSFLHNASLQRCTREYLRRYPDVPLMLTLTCADSLTRREATETLDRFVSMGGRNLLALRGDAFHGSEFSSALDLVTHLRHVEAASQRSASECVCIAVGGYPDFHPCSRKIEDPLGHEVEGVLKKHHAASIHHNTGSSNRSSEGSIASSSSSSSFILTQMQTNETSFLRYDDAISQQHAIGAAATAAVVPSWMMPVSSDLYFRLLELTELVVPKPLYHFRYLWLQIAGRGAGFDKVMSDLYGCVLEKSDVATAEALHRYVPRKKPGLTFDEGKFQQAFEEWTSQSISTVMSSLAAQRHRSHIRRPLENHMHLFCPNNSSLDTVQRILSNVKW